MSIGQVCTSQVVCIERNATVGKAAERMREFHVGTLVVVKGTEDDVIPVGLITDRDIVVGVVAARIDPEEMIVDEVMNPQLVTAQTDDDVYETIQMMSTLGVRRVPVLDHEGRLAGIVSQDDLFAHLSQEMTTLSMLSRRQQITEAVARA
jgi:CBS domain-containing protein